MSLLFLLMQNRQCRAHCPQWKVRLPVIHFKISPPNSLWITSERQIRYFYFETMICKSISPNLSQKRACSKLIAVSDLPAVFITVLFIPSFQLSFLYTVRVVHAENNNSYRKETCLLSWVFTLCYFHIFWRGARSGALHFRFPFLTSKPSTTNRDLHCETKMNASIAGLTHPAKGLNSILQLSWPISLKLG